MHVYCKFIDILELPQKINTFAKHKRVMAIQKQLAFFKENKRELCAKYHNQVIVVSCDLVVSSFDNLSEAYEYGVSEYGLGNFLLKKCDANSVDEIHIVSPHIRLA